MNSFTITKRIELTYKILGFDYLCFATDKKLYNTKTGRIKKRTLNNCTDGYWIGRKFYSLKQLKQKLIKIDRTYVPF